MLNSPEPSNQVSDAMMEHCSICKVKFVHGFWACDETMLHYCEDCWPAAQCEEKHGEGCATAVWI